MIVNKRGYIIPKNLLSEEEINEIKEDLTVSPQVHETFSFGEVSYEVFQETEDELILPRYYGIKKFGEVEIDLPHESVNMSFREDFELRDYQQEIMTELTTGLNNIGGGMLQLYCGGGKTVISIYLACLLKVKTLIIVHKTFLQDQWIERISEFTNARIGILRGDRIEVENVDIVVGMLQSISMRDYDQNIFNDFGLVIVDECHHIGSRVFSRALQKVNCRYTFGLSATPDRSDGLTCVINWFLGDIICQRFKQGTPGVEVRLINYRSSSKYFKEETIWTKKKGQVPCLPKMITNMSMIKKRNNMVCDIIDKLLQEEGRQILVLSGRIRNLEKLKERMDERISEREFDETTTGYYIGKTKPRDREISATCDIIFASHEMAEEGLDIPSLNTLIMVTPPKNLKKLEQCVGRIMRKNISEYSVKPLVIDFIDDISMLKTQGKGRKFYYIRQKYRCLEMFAHNMNLYPKEEYDIEEYETSYEVKDFI